MDILGEASRLMGGSRLRDMIRAVRACKTAAEERAVIAKECATLRQSFKENDIEYRHRNVAKLMFIHMLGYPTHFGQMECLKLIASPGFPEKRIGYLGLMVLLDERQEVLMLVTNSLKNDLNHTNQFICGLALCALGNICSAEMARDLAPEVERLLQSNNSYIRKKAALCSIRIVRKVPELAEYLVGPATGLLSDKHHGVLLSGTKLAIELCKANPQMLLHFRKQVATLVRILKNLVVSGYAPEYDVGGITDPFLQIRVLKLLRILGKGDPDSSDMMSDILAQVATNTEANKNTGNAILYECVNTIFGVESIGGLRVLAINILGRFLTNKDNNIRYVALNTLIKVVSVDTQAVQRHRGTVIECVKDSDISIRRRALDLVFALVNESNLQALTAELLEYLKGSDSEFKPDLTDKICAIVQRWSPTKRYTIDVLHQVMVEAGEFVKDEVVNFLVVAVSNAPELQGYTVREFFNSFRSWKGQRSLGMATAWFAGEYGEMLVNNAGHVEGEASTPVTEAEVVESLERILRDSRSNTALKATAMLALLKLTLRFPASEEKIKYTILQYRQSLVLELQQRAVEFSSILTRHDKLKSTLVDKMPALDETTYRTRRTDLTAAAAVDSEFTAGAAAVNGTAPAAVAAPALADLLDLSMDDTPAVAPAAGASAGGSSALLDILGGGAPGPMPAAPGGAAGASALLDLLSLGDPSPAPTPAAGPADLGLGLGAAAVPAAPAAPRDPLADLMGGPLTATAATPAPAAQPPLAGFGAAPARAAAAPVVDPFADAFGSLGTAAPSAPAFPSVVAFEGKGLKVTFAFVKDPTNPQVTTITASFSNASSQDFDDFVFQAAVPKFMQLLLEPASSSSVPASTTASVTQVIKVTNSMHGQKPLAMRLRISYKTAGQDVLEQAQVSNFPAGL